MTLCPIVAPPILNRFSWSPAPPVDYVRLGWTTFHFPKTMLEPVLVSRPLRPRQALRSTMMVKIAITDGCADFLRQVPFITMLRAAAEAEVLHSAARMGSAWLRSTTAFRQPADFIRRCLDAYANPGADDVARPVTGAWTDSDIAWMNAAASDAVAKIEDLERRRVSMIHDIAQIMQMDLYPWAPYEPWAGKRISPNGSSSSRITMVPAAAYSDPMTGHRRELCDIAARRLKGDVLADVDIGRAERTIANASGEAAEPQMRFIRLLQSMSRRSGGFGVTMGDIRLGLDLTPDADVASSFAALSIALALRAPACEARVS